MKKWVNCGWNVHKLQNGNCWSGMVVKQADQDLWRGEVYTGKVNPTTRYFRTKDGAVGFVERMLNVRHPMKITVEVLECQ